MASYPQKELKVGKANKHFRTPDFSVLSLRSKTCVLIWEVKPASYHLDWFGKPSSVSRAAKGFPSHFKQIDEQAKYAKAKYRNKPIYLILSINVWFILFHFPPRATVELRDDRFSKNLAKLKDNIVVSPSRIFNGNCTQFSPQFLYALQLCITGIYEDATLPAIFQPPEGAEQLVSKDLKKKRWFSAQLNRERERAEIEERALAALEEPSDDEWDSVDDNHEDTAYHGPRADTLNLGSPRITRSTSQAPPVPPSD